MTMLECLKKYLITDDSNLAAKLPGGLKPRILPQTSNTDFQTTAVARLVSVSGYRPTLDGGASPWCTARLEISVYSKTDLDAEQIALLIAGKFYGFDGYLGGSTNGRFSTVEVQGPRHLTDQLSRLPYVQIDIVGNLNRSTLS